MGWPPNERLSLLVFLQKQRQHPQTRQNPYRGWAAEDLTEVLQGGR